RSRRGLPEAVVEDVVVRPGDSRTASRLLRAAARAAPVALVSCLFPGATPQRTAARRRGFLPWRGGWPLVVRRTEATISPPPDRLGSWALSLGDLEIL